MKISIITIVYNNETHIEGCIKSIINQTYANIEYIVIDGKSTDNTLDIVNRYKGNIEVLVSEKDGGIADAMNKGIELATGDFIAFIHADDYLYNDDVIANAVKYITADTQVLLCDLLFGTNFERKTSRGLDFRTLFKTGIWHQGVLCAKSVFDEHGKFDESIRIAMDYDFFLRLYIGNVKATFCPEILSVMRDTGISSQLDWPTLEKRFNDEKTIHYKNTQSIKMKIVYRLYWALYLPYRKIIYLIKS
jgi:glycosyltransferase involved in cell wall biosynthesis